MKSIKSLFISLWLTVLGASAGWALWQLWQGADWRWLGVLASVLPALLFFGWLFALKPPRTSANLPLLQGVTWLGLGLTVVANTLVGGCWISLSLSAVALAGLYLYIFWYSRYPRRVQVETGALFPSVSLQQLDGQDIAIEAFRGAPLVLMFYRGNWCPLCMAQIREVAEQYQQLEKLGARVALVSPQPAGHSRELAAQFGVQFEFLVDRDNRAAQALGIVDRGNTPAGLEVLGYDSDTVMPTVYVLDADGRVLFAHLTDNYRVRPEPGLFLSVLAEAGVA